MSIFYFQSKMKIARGVLNKITDETFSRLAEVFYVIFRHSGWLILGPMVDIIIQKVINFKIQR